MIFCWGGKKSKTDSVPVRLTRLLFLPLQGGGQKGDGVWGCSLRLPLDSVGDRAQGSVGERSRPPISTVSENTIHQVYPLDLNMVPRVIGYNVTAVTVIQQQFFNKPGGSTAERTIPPENNVRQGRHEPFSAPLQNGFPPCPAIKKKPVSMIRVCNPAQKINLGNLP